jgi:hypothetical protein
VIYVSGFLRSLSVGTNNVLNFTQRSQRFSQRPQRDCIFFQNMQFEKDGFSVASRISKGNSLPAVEGALNFLDASRLLFPLRPLELFAVVIFSLCTLGLCGFLQHVMSFFVFPKYGISEGRRKLSFFSVSRLSGCIIHCTFLLSWQPWKKLYSLPELKAL